MLKWLNIRVLGSSGAMLALVAIVEAGRKWH